MTREKAAPCAHLCNLAPLLTSGPQGSLIQAQLKGPPGEKEVRKEPALSPGARATELQYQVVLGYAATQKNHAHAAVALKMMPISSISITNSCGQSPFESLAWGRLPCKCFSKCIANLLQLVICWSAQAFHAKALRRSMSRSSCAFWGLSGMLVYPFSHQPRAAVSRNL